jgi:tRNA 2-thiouridine synthesizing protein A
MGAPMLPNHALPEPVQVLDTSGLLCPIPIVKAAAAVKGLADGDVLLVIATDPGIATDMPMWCKAMRHEHLATYRDGPHWKSYLRKRARAPRAAEGAP